MKLDEFKYEVAFSFCLEDEQKAVEIDNLLSDRYSTFLYSKKQEELVGYDGVDQFSEIFSTQARIVVVFYRKKYGTTSWTQLEETAIKNRAMSNGDWDFTIYIPVENDKTIPKYLPSTRIWFDYNKYGPEGAALIIEKRITDLGGERSVVTSIDKAKKLKRKIEFEKKLNDYTSNYSQYLSDGLEEFENLRGIVKEKFRLAIEHFEPDRYKTIEEINKSILYRYGNLQVELVWLKAFKYSTDKPVIKVNLVEFISQDDFSFNYKPIIIKGFEYIFYKNILWESVWKEENIEIFNYLKTEVLAEKIVGLFFDLLDNPDKFRSNIGFW